MTAYPRVIPNGGKNGPYMTLESFGYRNRRAPARGSLRLCIGLVLLTAVGATAAEPPKAGPVEILPLDEVTPGMEAVAWTVFTGHKAESVPVKVLGIMRNSWGPGQHIIMAKLGGKAERTNVAGGMSGSPVYFDGKLMGAISLRFSTFSPDSIAGITPIELMLQIDELDQGRPIQAQAPEQEFDSELNPDADPHLAQALPAVVPDLARAIWDARNAEAPADSYITAIETPLTFSGFHQGVLDIFRGYFRRAGVAVMQGGSTGSSGSISGNGSRDLNPGSPIAAVLVSGDLSASGLGTVTYNDGKRVLAFGHGMFQLGPVAMPMAAADVITVLASQLNPVKIANAGEIVGALRQDRKSGILGVMGEEAPMIPIRIGVRRFDDNGRLLREKNIACDVFQNRRWTPPLIVFTLFNSIYGLNDFADESTFRLSGEINFEGSHRVSLETMRTSSPQPVPPPLLLAGWVGNKVQRVFAGTGETPRIESVDLTVDLLPKRRLALLENAWLERTRVRPGEQVKGSVVLRPYRGDPIERSFEVSIPASAPKGRLRVLISDAQTLDRGTRMAGARNRLMSLSETVSLLNKEHGNHQLFVTLRRPEATGYLDDKTLPNVPQTVLNVMQGTASRRLFVERESMLDQSVMSFDSIVSGRQTIDIEVQ